MADLLAVRSAATTPQLIQVGPGFLWTGMRKPADGAIFLVSGQASGVNDQRVYGPMVFNVSGTFIGSTIGESGIAYRPTFVDILIESSTAKVEKVLNTEEARCTFAIAELTAENVQNTLAGSGTNSVATLSTGADPLAANQIMHTIKVGGLRLLDPQCIAFISPNRRISAAGTQIFSYVFCGYNAISTEGFDAAFSRGKETVWRVAYEMIADTGRTIGDQLFQFTVRQSS